MPIHLPRVSRRSFLAGSLALGAGAMRPARLWGDDKPVDPHRWVLFSDTHIAASREAVARGTNMAANFAQATSEVLSGERRPAGLLINGDCAYLVGLPNDYGMLLELLDPLRQATTVHLALGNHDQRENFWKAFDQRDEPTPPLDGHHVALIPSERCNWLVLDSLDKTNVTPGRLGTEQLDWLGKTLDAHTNLPAIVMMHHHPVFEANPIAGLSDTQALFSVIQKRPQVKALIFGHTHHWDVREHEGIHLVNLPPVAYPFNNMDPSGWVDVALEPDGAVLTLRALNQEHRANGQRVELSWRKA